MKSLVIAVTLLLALPAFAADRLIVHEWGTFTCLQDESGQAVRGINTDDEPVPRFVHTLSDIGPRVVHQSTLRTPALGKAVPECHPDVKLRLETPVVYFYLPEGYTGPRTIGVHVAFQGGWLTEFYPRAEVVAPGMDTTYRTTGHITPDGVGELNWERVKLGVEGAGPSTTDRVWTAPRQTAAVNVGIPIGETEKFLFYRGVGNIDAPIALRYSFGVGNLELDPGSTPAGNPLDSIKSAKVWLVDIADDGSTAFTEFESVTATHTAAFRIPLDIQAAPHSITNLAALRKSMYAALCRDGLYADEADAMLNTWEVSYFKSAGTRLFFIVPKDWTDEAIPIKFSVPVDLTRVMMGRIELINPTQRALLKNIAATKVADYREFIDTTRKLLNSPDGLAGELTPVAASSLPAPYGDFIKLGRFRSALLLHEHEARPTPELSAFVSNLHISAAR